MKKEEIPGTSPGIVDHSSQANKLIVMENNGFYTINLGTGRELTMTLEDLKQGAAGLFPVGIRDKLTDGELVDLVRFVKNKRKIDAYTIEKFERISRGMLTWQQYFLKDTTSMAADQLQAWQKFLSVESMESKIKRLNIYHFERFYRPNGETQVAKQFEEIRVMMLKKAKQIHAVYDPYVRKEIEKLEKTLDKLDSDDDKDEKDKITKQIKALNRFLILPGNIEIKNNSLEEVISRLKARNLTTPNSLNKPPVGGVFRITVQDCTIEGGVKDGELRISAVPFSPTHKLTYVLNANFFKKNIANEARAWWDYTVKCMGYEGAIQFYELVGYLMVTQYPLPTERSIMVLVGDPGSGKGTHLGAVEKLLTVDQIRLFAKVSPHKLTDPKEHFSMQTLAGKIAVISGDLKHKKIPDFSEVNDIFGGEPQELEKKFRDPTVEEPVFKGLWASTPPLFKIDQAGGAWRRIQVLILNPVSEGNRDNELKQKMLDMIDGLFLNALTGLAYLATNKWKFTNEMSDSEIETLWSFWSDSIQVWAQNLEPEPDRIEIKKSSNKTLDGSEGNTTAENIDCRYIIDVLYEQYALWCAHKQIEKEQPKTFTKWLREHGFTISRRKIEDGKYKGERKYVVYASWSKNETLNTEQESNRARGDFSWEAYFSNAPLAMEVVPDSHGQFTHVREEKNNKNEVPRIELPSRIGNGYNQAQNSAISGSGNDSTPCPIRFEKSSEDEGNVSDMQPELSPDPENSDVQNETEGQGEQFDDTPNENIAPKNEIRASKNQPDEGILLENGNMIRDQLFDQGYLISPDSGTDINGKYYKIGIMGMNKLPDKKKHQLDRLFHDQKFTNQNTGAMGITWFSRLLRRDET